MNTLWQNKSQDWRGETPYNTINLIITNVFVLFLKTADCCTPESPVQTYYSLTE